MQDTPQNKQIGNKDFEKKADLHAKTATPVKLLKFYIPDLGTTVEAENIGEAVEKAKALIKSKQQ